MRLRDHDIYVGLVGILFMGLTLGTVPTSIPQFLLAAWWLSTGRFRTKINYLFSYTGGLLWSILWIWHIVAMAWTSDTNTGWNDIRIKIPMLLTPLLLSSGIELQPKDLKKIIHFFIIGLSINVFWSIIYMYMNHPNDPRMSSRYMSHIRLGYLIYTAIVYLIFFIVEEKKYRMVYLFLVFFFTFGVIYLGILSAAAPFMFALPFLVYILLRNLSGWVRWATIIGLFLIIFGIGYYSYSFYREIFCEKKISYNVPVTNNPVNKSLLNLRLVENGYNAVVNTDVNAIIRLWNRDHPSHPISEYHEHFFGLLRYMASKGLVKDSIGYSALKPEDKLLISRGISNYLYPSFNGFEKKIYEMMFSFRQIYYHGNFYGSSVGLRFYYWKMAFQIIKNNLWFGVGTGDVFQEMKEMASKFGIPVEWVKRPHQQFLSLGCALGLMGLVLFLWALIYPFLNGIMRMDRPKFYILLGMLVSFLYEDTLETQTGVSYVMFFYVLLTRYDKNRYMTS